MKTTLIVLYAVVATLNAATATIWFHAGNVGLGWLYIGLTFLWLAGLAVSVRIK